MIDKVKTINKKPTYELSIIYIKASKNKRFFKSEYKQNREYKSTGKKQICGGQEPKQLNINNGHERSELS